MLVNLEAFSSKDLQHVFSLLTHCKSEGVTDIRSIRQAIHQHLYKPQKVRPVGKKYRKMPKEHICPECGGYMTYISNQESLIILGCGDCRYSEVVSDE